MTETQEHAKGVVDLSRRKIVRIPDDQLASLLFHWMRSETVALPIFEGIPHDVQVVGIHYNYCCRALDICLSHPSFTPQPSKVELPVDWTATMHLIEIPKKVRDALAGTESTDDDTQDSDQT